VEILPEVQASHVKGLPERMGAVNYMVERLQVESNRVLNKECTQKKPLNCVHNMQNYYVKLMLISLIWASAAKKS